MTFQQLYDRLTKAAIQGRTQEELQRIRDMDIDSYHLDCLLYPDKCAPVWRIGDCGCGDEERQGCIHKCIFDALKTDEKGNLTIDKEKCTGCSACIDGCKAQNLIGRKDVLSVLSALDKPQGLVYALIAPAFIGQFSKEVTPGMLRSAFKHLGFTGMVEVALFADILTLKEALEFDRRVLTEEDFLLTSCCCPIWIAMIRKVYSQFITHVPGSVSPMVACGRVIKKLEPDAVTIFIGPCLAKKAEAKEQDIADAVDYVLTFEEIQSLFDLFDIRPAELPDDPRDHSSRAGRIYARTGGVSEAVKDTLDRLRSSGAIQVRAHQADGVPACREMMNALKEGRLSTNFLEGMGCVGGCVGGPKAVLNREEGRINVNQYGDKAAHSTPFDNPYVMELMMRLGFETVESLLDEKSIFARKF
jgi:iron only hydrogenase large subunit-like protein